MLYHILNHLLYEIFPLSHVYMLKTRRFGDRIDRGKGKGKAAPLQAWTGPEGS